MCRNYMYSLVILGFALILNAVQNEAAGAKYDTIIVGGGMAGLSAAAHLVKNGRKNVVIFEAQDKPGGRIKTEHFGMGKCLDLGSQWILGGRVVNSVFNLANTYQLIQNSSSFYNDSGIYVRQNGTCMDESFSRQVRFALEEMVEKLPFGPLRAQLLKTSKHIQKIHAMFPSNTAAVTEIINQYRNELAFELGDDLDHMVSDPKAIVIQDSVVLDNYCMDKVVMLLADEIIKGGGKIMYKHEVTKIEWKAAADAVVHVKPAAGGAAVAHHAMHVIFTASLGVIKADHAKLFVPDLPAPKLASLKNINFGKGEKIFACFNQPFWMRKQMNYLKFARPEHEYQEIGVNWVRRIPGFWEVRKHPNCLMTAVFGKVSLTIDKDQPGLKRKIRDILRKFTGDPSIPLPDTVYRTHWNDNKYIRGTYASPSLTFKEGDFISLSNPHYQNGKPRLMFAGEGMSRLYYGTMHGARNTGLRAANMILEEKK